VDYFLLLDGVLFAERMRPALAAGWRMRSFKPCREFCAELLPRVEDFDSRYHIGEGESLIKQVVHGLQFDRDFWRSLAGECLFYAADEIPEFQTCLETISSLLAPSFSPRPFGEERAPIQQAHLGSRDLTFGSVVYRPEHCRLNDREDVQRLAEYLTSIDPAGWLASALPLAEEEREEELEIAREWFIPLREMYQRAARQRQVIVNEIL
jgi:hypothetical protein